MIDWEPAIREIVANVRAGVSRRDRREVSRHAGRSDHRGRSPAGETCVVLSGGCFQNKYLTERAVCRLREKAFAHAGTSAPPNDGGIALGQIVAA